MRLSKKIRARVRFSTAFAIACAISVTNLNVTPVSASGALTLSVDYTPDSTAIATEVTPGNKVDLTATAPVAVAGTTEQEIIQDISPLLTLQSASDIVSPAGWSVSYSTDGTSWTTTAPTTAAGWAAIRKVKARGPLVSQGADSLGRQIASTDANAAQPTTGQFPTTTGSSGDGWDVFFDDAGHVFNIHHHNGAGGTNVGSSNQGIDCHLRTGESCGPTWPYRIVSLSTAPVFNMHTNEQSTGWFDTVENEIWFPTVYSSNGVNQVGFGCIKAGDVSLTNKWCGGTPDASFVSGGASANVPASGFQCGSSGQLYDCSGGLAVSDGRLYTWAVNTGDLVCVDIRLNNGAGGPCASGGLIDFGANLTNVKSGVYRWRPTVMEWDGRIYGNGGAAAKAVCIVAATGAACPGWTNPRTTNSATVHLSKLPTSTGGVAGVCYTTLSSAPTCFDASGSDVTNLLTTNFKTKYAATYVSTYDAYSQNWDTYGTRMYWGDSAWRVGIGKIYCWDFATDTWCKNWTASGIADTNYQIRIDPTNPYCIWSNADDGIIQTYDAYTGTAGNCAVPPPTAVFEAGVAIPRMACSSTDAIQAWRTFELTTTSSYTSAALTVKTSAGASIAGWTNVPLTPGAALDLSTLSVADSGQNPSFTVTFTGRTTNGDVSARITAVGGAPQLCLRPIAPLCPLGPIFTLAQLSATTTTVTAEGSATAGTTVTPLTSASVSVNIGARNQSLCAASLSGTALTTAGSPVEGALVTLTNSTGTPLTYPSDYSDVSLRGQVISVLTNASGQYSFPNVVPGTYAVRFTDVATAAVTGTSVVGGTTTSETTTAITQLTSAAKTLAAGTAGVIDATYTAFPTLSKRFFPSTVAKGQISTLIFTLTNSAGNGAKTNLGFVDTLPAGLVVDTNSNMMTTCPGGSTVTRDPTSMTATSGVVTVTNASITAGVASCEYSIAVRADVAGTYTNDSTNVTTTGLAKNTLATKVVTDESVSGKYACDTNLYHIIAGQLYRTDPRDSRLIPYEIGPNTLSGIDAIGFNVQDGFMYGIATTTSNGRTAGNLVRISSSGVVTDLGAISGATTSNMTGIRGGDFDDAGNLVVKSATNTATLYSINVSTRVATVITASATVPGEDLAYSNGYFYSIGWDGSNSKLYSIRKSDWTVTSKAVLPDQSSNAGEGIFTNGFGELIIGRTPTSGQHKLWRLSNPQTVTAASEWVLIGTGEGAIKDGATCHNTPVPTAQPDATSGPINTAQSVNLLTNDVKTISVAGVSTNFDASSIRLCDPNSNPVETAPNCTITPGTTITVAGVGDYVVSSLGVITFTPVNGYSGTPPPLGYQVADTNSQIASSFYTPTVTSTTPFAVDDTSTGPYDTNQSITPLTNDIAGSLGTLVPGSLRLCPSTSTSDSSCTLTSLTINGEGTYTVNPNGTVTFDPLPSFTGTASPVKYVVDDSAAQRTSAEIQATVGSPSAPVATPESKSVIPGGSATFTTLTGASGLATGQAPFDTTETCLITPGSSPASCDADGIVTIANEGTYTLNTATGVVTFVADANVTAGTKTALTYQVTDATGQTATSTLTPVVPPAPTATNDTSSGAYDTNQTISPLANDAAGTGATLVPSSVKLCATTSTANTSCNLTTLTVPGEGTYTVNANGTVTFNPLPTFTGTASAVKYVVSDTTGQITNATITPTVGMPAAPVANPESKTVIPGATATFTTITGSGALATSGVGLDTSATCLFTPNTTTCDADGIVTIAGEGTYTLNIATGVVTFVADANVTAGTKTAITYQVTDSFGQTATSTLTPIVPPAPTATNDSSSGAYDTNQTLSPLSNDTAGNGASLVTSSLRLCATTSTANSNCTLTSLVVPFVGTYTVNADGTVLFDPVATFTGPAPAVKYVVADTTGQITNAEMTASVGTPAVPIATPESTAVIPGGTATFTTITGSNGLATSGVGLNANATCLFTPGTTTCDADGVVTIAGEGTYTLNVATGVVTFVADVNATQGSKTPITYQVTDITGQTATSTLTPVIPAPPVATNDTSSGAYDTNQTISILTNDTVTSPATLIVGSVKLCATTNTANASCNLTTLTVPGEGTYTVNANGTVTFDPLPSFTGTASPVKYVVADSTGQLTNATITPTVALPGAPVATPESKAVIPGGTATFTTITGSGALATSGVGLNTNATCLFTPGTTTCDADGIVTIAGEGTYTLNTATGVVTFVADANATQGTKTAITYQVTDIFGQTVTSTLTPVIPAPPVATNDTSSGAYDTNQTISILTNDTVTSPATLIPNSVKLCAMTTTVNTSCSLTTLTVPGEGTYTVNANGTVTFDPLPSFTGTASPVKYVVADSTGQLTNATITPTVAMPATPVATPESKAVIPGGTATFTTVTGSNGLATSPVSFNTGATCLFTPGTTTCDADGIVTIAGEGTYTLNTATGVVTFVADVNATQGSKTPITYRVTDIFGQTATSTLTPIIPAPPVATNDISSGAHDTNQTISILTNDNAASPATLVGSTVKLCATTSTVNSNCSLTTLTVVGEGTYTVNSNGTVTFDPLPTFTGTASPVKYIVADSTGQITNATITPTVLVPPAPSASNNISSGAFDTNQVISPLANDTFSASAPPILSTLKLCAIDDPTTGANEAETPGNCTRTTITVAGEGTYTVNSNGTVTFDPFPMFVGTVQTPVRYQVSDILGRTVNATITPTVLPPPPPVASPQTLAVVPGGTVNFANVNGNNGLASGVGLQAGATNGPCIVDPTTQVCGTTVTISGEGTWTIDQSTGIATFVAVAGLREGTHTSVTYRVTDYFGQVATSTLTPVVPTAPRAANDNSTGLVDTNQLLTPFKNDTFSSLAPVDVSTLRLCQPTTVAAAAATGSCNLLTVTVAGEGTYTVNADGTVTFDPLPTFSGVATAIPYEAVNALGQKVEALLTPTVLAAKVVDQKTSTKPSTPVTLAPFTLGTPSTGNVFVATTLRLYDPSTKKWSTRVVTAHGLWELRGSSVKFTPRADFTGTAVLPFRVKDSAGIVVRANLKVVVQGKAKLPQTGTDMSLLLLMALTFIGFGTAVAKRK